MGCEFRSLGFFRLKKKQTTTTLFFLLHLHVQNIAYIKEQFLPITKSLFVQNKTWLTFTMCQPMDSKEDSE